MLPCNGSWKLDLSTSNDEINDLNIALERTKESEHQVAQNAAKLDAANKTNVELLSDLYGHEMKSFSFVFLEYLCEPILKKFGMLMELVKPYIHLISFPNSKVLKTCLFSTQSCYQSLQYVAMDYICSLWPS